MSSDYEYQELLKRVRAYKSFSGVFYTAIGLAVAIQIIAFVTGQRNNLFLSGAAGILFFGVGGYFYVLSRRIKGKPRLADAAREANAVALVKKVDPGAFEAIEVFDRSKVENFEAPSSNLPNQASRKACPMCAEDISANAKICRHCGSNLEL